MAHAGPQFTGERLSLVALLDLLRVPRYIDMGRLIETDGPVPLPGSRVSSQCPVPPDSAATSATDRTVSHWCTPVRPRTPKTSVHPLLSR
ncbi:hypothetical protein GCM10023197_05150 [Gordonia humi]